MQNNVIIKWKVMTSITIKTCKIGTFTEFIHETGSWSDEMLAAQKKWESYYISRLQEWNGSIVSSSQVYTQSDEQLYPINIGNIKYINYSESFL